MPRAQSEVFVAATPEDVWALISDLERGPEWSVVTLQCEITSGKPAEVGCTYRSVSKFAASKITTEHEIVEWDPPHRMVTSITKGAESKVTWTCQPQDGGTLLTMSNEFDVPAALSGLIADKLARQVTDTLAQELARIKEVVEESQGGTQAPSVEDNEGEPLSVGEGDR